MDKSRIFIASSGRTLLLAEKLRDELRTEYCDPRLWSEESKSLPGATIIEMLEEESEHSDFAVIILSKDDVMTVGSDEALKARDNCVFEAGLFMSAIGRNRCFLVNSVKQSDLPSDLGGIISVRFDEPADLTDRSACEEAIAGVSARLKDAMQKLGPSAYHVRFPVFSVDELFARERPLSDGGDLMEDFIIVVDKQPGVDVERAEQIWRNVANGNSYHYFFYFDDNTTIERICQELQMIAWLGVRPPKGAPDFNARLTAIQNEKDRALGELRNLNMRFTLLLTMPTVSFRLHNASDSDRARLYVKRPAKGEGSMQFVLWAEGPEALSTFRALPQFLEEDRGDRLFIPMKVPLFDDDKKRRLEESLSLALRRYFPGMESEVKKILIGDRT